jgi:FkbM family methyltransferase
MKEILVKTNYDPIKITVREDSDSDEAIIDEIFVENVYRLHDSIFSSGGVVLDVGANIGVFTLKILLHAKENGVPVKIYAIEPEPNNLKLLKQNLKHNDWLIGESEVIIISQGISDKNGKAFISDNHGGSRLAEKGAAIDLITLDYFIQKEKIENVVFAKFDIEGSEVPSILAASDETIDKLHYTAIEFDEQNGLEKFAEVINRFGRHCQINTLGVPARGCYIYTERFE